MRPGTYARGPVPAGRRLPPAGRRKAIPRRVAIGHGSPGENPIAAIAPGRNPWRTYILRATTHIIGQVPWTRICGKRSGGCGRESGIFSARGTPAGRATSNGRVGSAECGEIAKSTVIRPGIPADPDTLGLRTNPGSRSVRALVPGAEGRSKGARQRLHHGAISGQHRGKPDAVLQRGGCRGMHRIRGLDLQRREVLAG